MGTRWALYGLLALSVSGCSSQPVQESRVDAPLVQEKYRLSADREAFDQIRSQIPDEQRRQNDEKSFLEQLMADPSKTPSRVREEFQKTLTRRRAEFNKDMERRRTDFVRKERGEREDFTRSQSSRRQEIKSQKLGPEERRRAYDDLEKTRQDFYENQRERRSQFEADRRDDRQNFEDYVREVTADFNQRHRDFTQRHKEHTKLEEARRREAADAFKKMDEVPPTPLGP